MKVHLIRKETIENYIIDQARSRPSFEEWLEKIRRADWQIRFGASKVHLYIKWIGTHAEYNLLCKKKQQYSVNEY